MTPKTLRVRLRAPREGEAGPPRVPNYERLEARVGSYVGLRFDRERGEYVPTNQAAEIPPRGEYFKALRDGDLLPADEATARYAGIAWGPEFHETDPAPPPPEAKPTTPEMPAVRHDGGDR